MYCFQKFFVVELLLLCSGKGLEIFTDPPIGPPPGFRWAVVNELSDEFSEPTVNSSKWLRYHPYWSGRESVFTPENVLISNGHLLLRSTYAGVNRTDGHPSIMSACLSSKAAIATRGSFFEARVRASRLQMTSSFWLQGKYSEIDVIENMGEPQNATWSNSVMYSNTHNFTQGWTHDTPTPRRTKLSSPVDSTFYVFGVYWLNATTIHFYANGIKVQEAVFTKYTFEEPMYLFFDTEVFTFVGWPTISSLQDESANAMSIDYVRSFTLLPVTQ
jgi:hypothetical protein